METIEQKLAAILDQKNKLKATITGMGVEVGDFSTYNDKLIEAKAGLETANTELQTTNAELTTLNATLTTQNQELQQSNTTLTTTNLELVANIQSVEEQLDDILS